MDIKIEMIDPAGGTVFTQTFEAIVDIFECKEVDKVEIMPGLFCCREEPMKKNRYIITIGESVYRIVNNKGLLERIVPKEID